jgi:hypothetical protein
MSATPSQKAIRREKVTYGRRRNASDAVARAQELSVPEPRKRSFDTEVIPDSEGDALGRPALPDDQVMEGATAAESHEWDWRKRLQAMDVMPEDQLASFRKETKPSSENAALTPNRASTPVIPAISTSAFDSSFSSLAASSPVNHQSRSPTPPPVAPQSKRSQPTRHRSHPPVIGSSPPVAAGDSQTTESSPHPFGTPQDGPSQTPPTSDDDADADADFLPAPLQTSRSKGKERERDVPPIPLTDSTLMSSEPRRHKSKAPRNTDDRSKKTKVRRDFSLTNSDVNAFHPIASYEKGRAQYTDRRCSAAL